MTAREIGMVEQGLTHLRGAGHHVDDPVGQAGLPQNLHDEMGREHGVAGGLPHHGVAHHGRGRAQVSRDGREVERRDREDVALQRPVLAAVPLPLRGEGLHGVDLLRELEVAAPEVYELAGRVYLGLVDRLGLAEHGGRVEDLAVGPGQELGGAQEDGSPVREGHGGPFLAGLHGGLDGLQGLLLPGLMIASQELAMVVRGAVLAHVPGPDLLAPDDQGDVQLQRGQLLELGADLSPLGTAGGIVQDGLVGRLWKAIAAVVHARSSWLMRQGLPGPGLFQQYFRPKSSRRARHRRSHFQSGPRAQNGLDRGQPRQSSRFVDPCQLQPRRGGAILEA